MFPRITHTRFQNIYEEGALNESHVFDSAFNVSSSFQLNKLVPEPQRILIKIPNQYQQPINQNELKQEEIIEQKIEHISEEDQQLEEEVQQNSPQFPSINFSNKKMADHDQSQVYQTSDQDEEGDDEDEEQNKQGYLEQTHTFDHNISNQVYLNQNQVFSYKKRKNKKRECGFVLLTPTEEEMKILEEEKLKKKRKINVEREQFQSGNESQQLEINCEEDFEEEDDDNGDVDEYEDEDYEDDDEEEEDEEDEDLEEGENSEISFSTLKKKIKQRRIGQMDYYLDNVKVNKLKNFYKTFLNRISQPLRHQFSGQLDIILLIDKLCIHSNQRNFLKLFPHLRQKQIEQSNEDDPFLSKLRRAAFIMFAHTFHQVLRVVKCNKSFKQLEEFMYGCLYYAERSSKIATFMPTRTVQIFQNSETSQQIPIFRFSEPDLQLRLDAYDAQMASSSANQFSEQISQFENNMFYGNNHHYPQIITKQKETVFNNSSIQENHLNLTHIFY